MRPGEHKLRCLPLRGDFAHGAHQHGDVRPGVEWAEARANGALGKGTDRPVRGRATMALGSVMVYRNGIADGFLGS